LDRAFLNDEIIQRPFVFTTFDTLGRWKILQLASGA
jgi:hypothetical protein